MLTKISLRAAAVLVAAICFLSGMGTAADRAIQANATTKTLMVAQAKAPAPLYIDVNTLPKEIEVEVGQQVIFLRNKRLVGSTTELKSVTTDGKTPSLFKEIDGPGSNNNNTHFALGGFTIERKGTGYVRVSSTAVVPFPTSTSHQYVRIKVK